MIELRRPPAGPPGYDGPNPFLAFFIVAVIFGLVIGGVSLARSFYVGASNHEPSQPGKTEDTTQQDQRASEFDSFVITWATRIYLGFAGSFVSVLLVTGLLMWGGHKLDPMFDRMGGDATGCLVFFSIYVIAIAWPWVWILLQVWNS